MVFTAVFTDIYRSNRVLNTQMSLCYGTGEYVIKDIEGSVTTHISLLEELFNNNKVSGLCKIRLQTLALIH